MSSKPKADNCINVKAARKTNVNSSKQTLKCGNQLKREKKKIRKLKTQEENDSLKSEDEVDGPSSPKRRKLKTVSLKKLGRQISKIEDFKFKWTDEQYLAELENVSITTAKNIIDLISTENTIPFIARYRGDLTGNLKPDKLRQIKATYEYIQSIHKKAKQLIREVLSSESASSDLISYIQTAHTLEELEFIGSQFNRGNKRSLAERAKEMGLETPAKLILEGKGVLELKDFVKPNSPELKDAKKVGLGIQHVIADIISKNPEVHALLEKIYASEQVLLKSKFKVKKTEKEKTSSKYHLYGDFSQSLKTIKPHQTLAMNRGEREKELTLKIVIPNFLWLDLKTFCNKKWLKHGCNYELRNRLVSDSVDDAIKRLLCPLAIRHMRAKLNAEAENEALNCFALNLRQLLMTPPCSGHVVMGIDPGFRNGCKLAIVSHTGDFLDHDIFWLDKKSEARIKLKSLLLKHKCEVIALGNGTACRETEILLSDFIKKGIFKPLNVRYTIVNEQGVSIYSCSPVAAEEFPNMDPKIVGSISLARRLQNPLSELVKVEPKHLGVGMYQHDVKEKRLVSTLDDIVSECVSFVGVDINSASFYLLKRIAGLNALKAQEIIKYRSQTCSFKSREDLKKVKGIKTKTFQQCAGFIRVIPATARCIKHSFCEKEFNPFDETSIHPESYNAAHKIINHFNLNLKQLGSENFVQTVNAKKNSVKTEELARACGCSILSVEFIIDSLTKLKEFDLRNLSPGPIFRKEINKLEDLFCGQILEGVVRNIVDFGAFVDVGVGPNGLIHKSKMRNISLQLNERVKVKVISTQISPPKIELSLLAVIQ